MAVSKKRAAARLGLLAFLAALLLYLAVLVPHLWGGGSSPGTTPGSTVPPPPGPGPSMPPPPTSAPPSAKTAWVEPSVTLLGDRVAIAASVCKAGSVSLNRTWSCSLTVTNTQTGSTMDWDPVLSVRSTGSLALVSVVGPSLPAKIAAGETARFTLEFAGPSEAGTVAVPIAVTLD